jgi:H+/Cl- antiporter ClcA
MKENRLIEFAFSRNNYVWLIIGIVINVIGFMLMIGGGTEDYTQFNENELFSARRITIAPILVVAGYVVILWAIMRSFTKKSN